MFEVGQKYPVFFKETVKADTIALFLFVTLFLTLKYKSGGYCTGRVNI